MAVIANHLLLISALWEAADSAGEYHSNDAGNASELLGIEKVTLGEQGEFNSLSSPLFMIIVGP